MNTFNVLTDPWLPVQTRGDGKVREMGLLDVLVQAHDLDSLVDPAPPIQLGLYRLLIAFVMDALELRELDEVVDLLDQGRFDPAVLTRYVDKVGRDRFDLFHSEYPFLQTHGADEDPEKTKSVAELFYHLPTGTNVIHFHHLQADDHALSPAVCARALCSVAPFMTAGGAGYSPSINGAPPWYVLIRGENLFQTLLLNTYTATDLGLREGVPPWCTDQTVVPRKEKPCRSLIEGLTWRPRYIRLLPGDEGVCTYSGKPSPVLVRRMFFGPGFKFADTNWTDPQVAYRAGDKGRPPVRPREDKQPWRDTGPLLLLREGDYVGEQGKVRFSRPAVIDQLRRLPNEGFQIRSDQEIFEIYGMRVDKAKVFEWQYDRLALPKGVGGNPLAGQQVQQAMETADTVAYFLKRALKQAYPRGGGGNEKALDRVIQRAQAGYWSVLRGRFFTVLLPSLAVQDYNDSAAIADLAHTWNDTVRKEGWRALESAVGPLDTDAEALARQQAALAYFGREVQKLLNPPEPDAKKSKGRRTGT